MSKIYAIVNPAYTKSGDSFTDLASYLISPFHAVAYEHVCGYSLGHEIVFSETLEDAKKILEDGIKGTKLDAKKAIQKAVLELETDEKGEITGFGKIYTVNFDKRFEQAEDNFFKCIRIPKWSDRAIDAKKDATPDALAELFIQYERSKQAVTEHVSM
ncbi:hypothetical protein OQJ19_12255 [Fluoribacter gormanii]|uniref:Uncharacterized protein n=1 Tax=Fluoribacter gormanii TaxID=464 RepID=A0A377GL23_9GAMM|nr:hypothetical protein [Fluoribacter gormanii]KTD01759.1 hypothetical protein Lgor_2136 [Fluoribacter gormanii]MCW8471412.1 hypothetical protein [Fluoribacter gormanii]SIR19819.1 hypothetical protein SAMN05421777_1083 [Fluoribacter gormanii]STO25471.1 Uncharacterised protein [Fluoribacter gormanii]